MFSTYQDAIFLIGNLIFFAALIPMMRAKFKPAPLSSLMTGGLLAIYAFTFLTLHLPKSAAGSALTSVGWFFLLFQALRPATKEPETVGQWPDSPYLEGFLDGGKMAKGMAYTDGYTAGFVDGSQGGPMVTIERMYGDGGEGGEYNPDRDQAMRWEGAQLALRALMDEGLYGAAAAGRQFSLLKPEKLEAFLLRNHKYITGPLLVLPDPEHTATP